MQMIVKMVNGESLIGDVTDFKHSYESVRESGEATGTPREVVTQMITSINSLLKVISDGVKNLSAFELTIDGIPTYLNTDEINYMQIVGVKEWIEDAIAFGEANE